jgi:hypothetical protein
MHRFEDLQAGLTPAAALEAFRDGCNRGSDRLFVTESWFARREQDLRAALPDPLTPEAAAALRDAVLKKLHIDRVIDWLEHGALPWADYQAWRTEENRRLAIERMRVGYFPWDDVDACRGRAVTPPPEQVQSARSCPECGAEPGALTWIHFRSPAWTWEQLCGREGWLSVCDRCRMQIDFCLEVMN